MVLRNGNDTISVANGNFTFPTGVVPGGTYSITVASPQNQGCAFVNPNMSVGAPTANISNLAIACVQGNFAIRGTVNNLVANNNVTIGDGVDTVLVGNGAFILPTALVAGTNYAVSILGAPGQTCSFVNNGNVVSGVLTGNVTGLAVQCTANLYAVGGVVSPGQFPPRRHGHHSQRQRCNHHGIWPVHLANGRRLQCQLRRFAELQHALLGMQCRWQYRWPLPRGDATEQPLALHHVQHPELPGRWHGHRPCGEYRGEHLQRLRWHAVFWRGFYIPDAGDRRWKLQRQHRPVPRPNLQHRAGLGFVRCRNRPHHQHQYPLCPASV